MNYRRFFEQPTVMVVRFAAGDVVATSGGSSFNPLIEGGDGNGD